MGSEGFENKMEHLVKRHEELGEALSDAAKLGDDFASVSKEYSDLTPIVEAIQELRSLRQEEADLSQMLEDPETDKEMHALALEEQRDLRARIPTLEKKLQRMLLPKDEADEKNVILEVRAGTGGDEAALFAADLLRMYQRYAERHNFKFELLDTNDTGIGGIKEATASIAGKNVFARLKFESGVHRVQRVPETESSGRIHTSAATVAVLPQAEDVDIHIEEKDLRVDTYRAQGAGGQHVNKTDSAVRITHVPTGVVVQCQDSKSQHANRTRALQVLRSRLYEIEGERLASERSEARKSQIGSGDRSERIRTYNFPQGRVTDHRVNLTVHNLNEVLDGDLDEIIDTLTAEDEAERLAHVE